MWYWRRRHRGPRAADAANSAANATIPAAKSAAALYQTVARKRLDAQTAEIDAIDAKAASMFTIGSAVLPVTASLLTAARSLVAASAPSKWALVAGAGFYAALVVAFVLAYRLAEGQEITVGRREEELQRWLGDAYVAAYQANVPQLRKAALVGAALWLLAGEAASLTVAVLAPLF